MTTSNFFGTSTGKNCIEPDILINGTGNSNNIFGFHWHLGWTPLTLKSMRKIQVSNHRVFVFQFLVLFFCSFFTATTINGFSLCLFYYGAYLHFIKITIFCLPIPHFVCKNYEIKIHELLLPYAWSLSVVITVNEILRIFSIATFRISDSSNRHLIFTCHVLFGKRLNDRIENRIGSTPELTSEHSSSGSISINQMKLSVRCILFGPIVTSYTNHSSISQKF